MTMTDQEVVILGHTGFIGRRLHQLCASKGALVHGYSSATLNLHEPDAFTCLDAVVGTETIVIVSAAVTPDRGATLDALSRNLIMTLNLAQYLERHAVAKCVYLSSDAIYPFGDETIREQSNVEPTGAYAIAKYTGERILETVAARQAFPCLILRPTAVFGPGDTHNSYGPNRFVRTLVNERVVRLFGAGDETRDHIFIDDLVHVIAELSVSQHSGVFNVATGASRSFASVVEDLKRISPYEFEVIRQPGQQAVTHRRFDIARLRQALPSLGFTPFDEGLEKTLAWARADQRDQAGCEQ
jgi:UDP-glucose 4-epimerase